MLSPRQKLHCTAAVTAELSNCLLVSYPKLATGSAMCIFMSELRIPTAPLNSLSSTCLLKNFSVSQRFTLVLPHYAFYKKRFDSFFHKNKMKK